MTDNWFNKI